MASYDDGRIGSAAGATRDFISILSGVLDRLTIEDIDKAAEIAGRLSRNDATAVLATTIDDIIPILVDVITAARDTARLSTDTDNAVGIWQSAATACAALAADDVSPSVAVASSLARAVAAMAEAACLGEYAIAVAQSSFVDRESALAAKISLAAFSEPALERIAGAAGQDVWACVRDAVDQAVSHLTDMALTLRSAVRVITPLSMPATVLAWAIYGDTQRAAELVERNRVATPAFMPTAFEALAPSGAAAFPGAADHQFGLVEHGLRNTRLPTDPTPPGEGNGGASFALTLSGELIVLNNEPITKAS